MAVIPAPDIRKEILGAFVAMHPAGGDICITLGYERSQRGQLLLVLKKLKGSVNNFSLVSIDSSRELFFDKFTAVVGYRDR
jgi:hypothetical protein